MSARPLPTPITRFDALRLPGLRRVARMRYGRLVFQLPLLVVAVLLVYDGFTGSARASQNLATVIPWIHYRGLVIVALLLVGNLFCMGCPFTLPRTLAKRFSLGKRHWPKRLRGKWVAIAGLFTLFFLYEWLDMWSSPALTAWVIVAYFIASFALEAWFGESAFCKYVCPLGTFNFVYSTASPLKIGVRDAGVCATCVGKECVNGSYRPQPVVLIDQIGVNGEPLKTHTNDHTGTPGCGTLLFPPQMQTNLDCTLCLDCARACPHDNVGLFARAPGAELARADSWPKRWDLSFLVITLAFLGVINAFGMVAPVYDLMTNIAAGLGLPALGWSDQAMSGVALLVIFVVGGLFIPVVLTLTAAWLTQALTRKQETLRHTVAAFAPAFVPLGLGLWAAHYGYHLLTGLFSFIPAAQVFLRDHGLPVTPDYSLVGITNLSLIGLIQTVLLLGGFVWSMIIAQGATMRLYKRQATLGLLPWALLFLVMMLAGLWLFSQPMDMRGTVLFD